MIAAAIADALCWRSAKENDERLAKLAIRGRLGWTMRRRSR